MMGDGQATPRRILATPRVRARRRRHGVGRLSLRPRCRWVGRRTSHATRGVGGPVARERGDDHVSHDPAGSWGGRLPASVSPPARRWGGRSPDRPEDLLGIGEMRLAWDPPDRWRMDEVSPDGGFTLLSTPDGDVRLSGDRGCSVHLFATDASGPFASVVEAPVRTLDELGASGGSVVSAAPRQTIAGIPAECFRAIGGSAETSHRVESCFSRSGLLLYPFDGVQGDRVTTVEATTYRRSWPTETSSCRPPD